MSDYIIRVFVYKNTSSFTDIIQFWAVLVYMYSWMLRVSGSMC